MNTQQERPGRPGQRDRKDKFVRTNWKIKARECRLVEEGRPPRMMPTREALAIAQEAGLDLVEVNYDFRADVATCKICDYGKLQYDEKRRQKEARRAAKAGQAELKCLQISMTTDTADLDRIIGRGREFLQGGHRVRLALRLRGRREMANVETARRVLADAMARFSDVAVVDQPVSLAGRELSCVFRKGQPAKGGPGITISVG